MVCFNSVHSYLFLSAGIVNVRNFGNFWWSFCLALVMKAPILPPRVVQLIGTILIKVVSGGLEWHRLVEEMIGTHIRVISSSFGHFLLSCDCFKFWWVFIGNVGVGNKSLGLYGLTYHTLTPKSNNQCAFIVH